MNFNTHFETCMESFLRYMSYANAFYVLNSGKCPAWSTFFTKHVIQRTELSAETEVSVVESVYNRLPNHSWITISLSKTNIRRNSDFANIELKHSKACSHMFLPEWDSSAPPFRRWTFWRWNLKRVFLWNVTKVQKFALPSSGKRVSARVSLVLVPHLSNYAAFIAIDDAYHGFGNAITAYSYTNRQLMARKCDIFLD